MPEGPEVRRQSDQIHEALAGRVAQRVFFAFSALAEAGRALEGRRIERVTARGKALLMEFEGDQLVYTHNQLYGRWFVRRSTQPPKSRRSLRFSVTTTSTSAWLYSASTIEILDRSAVDRHPFLGALGPDVLDSETSAKLLRARLRDPRFRGRSLGALLLDQRFLAGLGNYLRSEILFRARIGPELRPRDLPALEVRRLADAILEISRRAYENRGVTNDPRVVARARALDAPRRSYRHYVFGRAGQPCPRCGAAVRKEEHAGRRLYRCGHCQPG